MTEISRAEAPSSLRPEIFKSPEVAERFRPEHTAIIVVDPRGAYFEKDAPWPKEMQQFGFTTDRTDEMSSGLAEFLQAVRPFSPATIVFTRFEETIDTAPENVAFIMKYDKTPRVISQKDGVGWEYYGVQPEEGDHEIEKKRFSAFRETDLHDHLQSKGVKSVIIVGGYRSVCVPSTAFAASQIYDYNTLVLNDLTANLESSEGPQRGAIEDLELVSIFTANGSEVIRSWEDLSAQPAPG